MSEDLERALRARKEFDIERDKRLEERWQAQDRSVTERFQAQERAMGLQLVDLQRRVEQMERAQHKLIWLVIGVPTAVTAIIVYLVTASPAS